MEDELEDRVFYQTYASHARLVARASLPGWGWGWGWGRLARLYLLRYEVVLFSLAMVVVLMYIQAVDVWSRALLGRLGSRSRSSVLPSPTGSSSEHRSWDLKTANAAAYALQGRRPRMEDRFVVDEDVRRTGVSLFAIFDGHGGEFAADYARDHLIPLLSDKILAVKDVISGKATDDKLPQPDNSNKSLKENPLLVDRNKSFKKTMSMADDTAKKEVTDPELLSKLSLSRPITREVRPTSSTPVRTVPTPLSAYVDAGKINYGKLISDQVLAVDKSLVEEAKKTMDVAGTTALIAILENEMLTVANVGDSRGVMCDSKGNAIPLSFDHKPQQMREQKRIKEAGGFIAFNGVWRVAGILATSRAMGDYPLKDKKYVVADPDVLTFNLTDHKPLFVILATDGLWDTFSNEEAVNFIKERLDEPLYGAKSLTLQSYYRGSVDNITILIVNFKDKKIVVSSTKNDYS
ncbi:protein phosphatase 1L [Arctopsyche grandis]|uniref:protein phosphatase 1L n=1 Tax=Arctopsyche grandis TaxID=121162 RepID=UPI00406D72A3